MNIDLTAIAKQVKNWDLTVEIDGTKHAIRRLSSADFKQLTDLASLAPATQNKFLLGLFEAKKKPTLNNEEASALLGVVMAYYQEHVIRKNFEAAKEAVRLAAT
jgi:hypothetical protein